MLISCLFMLGLPNQIIEVNIYFKDLVTLHIITFYDYLAVELVHKWQESAKQDTGSVLHEHISLFHCLDKHILLRLKLMQEDSQTKAFLDS